MRGTVGRQRRRATVLALTGAIAASTVAACASPESLGHSASPSTRPVSESSSTTVPQLAPETLTFGVVGSPGEVAQYRTMAETFAPLYRQVTVKVEGWPTDDAMLAAFRSGQQVPDVFLANRRYLPYLTQHELVQPIDQLLDDRGFDFGDEYPRSSLTAFSNNNRLECLPYGMQPEVIFYNKRLLQLRRIRNAPTPGQGWSLQQFATAARWAVHHHPRAAGIHLDADLMGIAPLIYSGGGNLFDSSSQPTSLALSSSANVSTLIQMVRALRVPGSTLTPAQLARRSPLAWFSRGKLAMLEGSRRLVPELRAVPGLRFDVMPMPSLGTPATIGSLTGMCISNHASDIATAADFLVYASSPNALALVSYGGYLQPANQTVALSDAFQQPDRPPHHAFVFTFSVKSMVYPPAVPDPGALDLRVDPLIERILGAKPADVPRLARGLDKASYRILGPRLGPSAIPTS